MKQLLTLFFTILLGTQLTLAQSTIKLESFRNKVLPQFSTYFTQAQLTENNQLELAATDKYIVLDANTKSTVILNIANAWRDSLVLVQFGTKHELWGWNSSKGSTKLLDEWDMAILPTALAPIEKAPEMILHPWFLYLGGQLMLDSQKNINMSINTRLGFYLLLNRWDLATTISSGVSGNADSDGTLWSNIGVMSRVHFPIKKYGISPNIGGEISLASFGDTQRTFTPSLVLGLSWFVGFGRLDIGIKIGDITTAMGGYSMYPALKPVK